MIPSVKELKKTIWFKEGDRSLSQADWFATYVAKEVSIYVTWVLLHTPVTANQVTVLSVVATLIGGGLIVLSAGNLWLWAFGAILMLLGELLDCVDGEIARYRKTASLTGAYLDTLGHFIEGESIVAFIALATYRSFPEKVVVVLGFLAMMAVTPSAANARVHTILGRLLEMRKAETIVEPIGEKRGGRLRMEPREKIDYGLGLHPTLSRFLTFAYPMDIFMFSIAALLDIFVSRFVLLGHEMNFMYLLLVWCVIALVPKEIFSAIRTLRLRRVDKEYELLKPPYMSFKE